jgi:hypothetical protein
MINGLIYANKDILPARNLGNERKTRETSNPDIILFRAKKCKTVTYTRPPSSTEQQEYGTFFLMNSNNSLFPCPHLNLYFTDITLLLSI